MITLCFVRVRSDFSAYLHPDRSAARKDQTLIIRDNLSESFSSLFLLLSLEQKWMNLTSLNCLNVNIPFLFSDLYSWCHNHPQTRCLHDSNTSLSFHPLLFKPWYHLQLQRVRPSPGSDPELCLFFLCLLHQLTDVLFPPKANWLCSATYKSRLVIGSVIYLSAISSLFHYVCFIFLPPKTAACFAFLDLFMLNIFTKSKIWSWKSRVSVCVLLGMKGMRMRTQAGVSPEGKTWK